MKMFLRRVLPVVSILAGMSVVIAWSDVARVQGADADVSIIADQIRSQGFACTNAVSAGRVPAESAPEKPVYVLKCNNGTY